MKLMPAPWLLVVALMPTTAAAQCLSPPPLPSLDSVVNGSRLFGSPFL